MDGDKVIGYKTIWHQDRPLCFDYKMISDKFGINLDSYTGDLPDMEDVADAREERKEEDLPFPPPEKEAAPY